MSNLASTEADLGAATRASGTGSGAITAARALFLLAFLALWQGAVAVGLANAAFVSTPASVVQSLWQLVKDGEVVPDLATTLLEIMMAFLLSVVCGITSAVFLDRNDWVNRS